MLCLLILFLLCSPANPNSQKLVALLLPPLPDLLWPATSSQLHAAAIHKRASLQILHGLVLRLIEQGVEWWP